jgi:hypothetical protein
VYYFIAIGHYNRVFNDRSLKWADYCVVEVQHMERTYIDNRAKFGAILFTNTQVMAKNLYSDDLF